jgi:hypothetical protein
VRIAVIAALVGSVGVCMLALAQVRSQPLYAAFAIPFGSLVIVSAAVVPAIWDRGRR